MLIFGLGAANAEAASISLTLSPDPAEEQAFTLTVSGTADKSAYLFASLRPAGGAPCASTAANETGTSLLSYRTVSAGAYSVVTTYTPESPGSFLLCAYLGEPSVTSAATSATATVRPNRATLMIAAPATAIPDQPVIITFGGATEVSRQLFSTVKPAGSTACGNAAATDVGGQSLTSYRFVQGAYSAPASATLKAGAYVICAWVQDGPGDLSPDAVASAAITVQPPDVDRDGVPDATDRCPARPGPGSKKGCPPRLTPAAFTAKATRKRDRRAPYTFGFSGRLTPSLGVTSAEACKGTVSVQVRRDATTLSTRRRGVRRDCTWVSTIRFANRSRVGRTGRLKVFVRFRGNDVLSPRNARTLTIRAG